MPIWIRIRICMVMPIQMRIRIRISINTITILMRILLQVLRMLENLNLIFYTLSHSAATVKCLSFSSVSYVSYVFSIFGQHTEIFWRKIYFLNFLICLEMELMQIRIGRIRIDMPWVPIPIPIPQNDADPTRSRSGSTTLHYLRYCLTN
jgi:hypothetical protein